jgi:hypothetical protein
MIARFAQWRGSNPQSIAADASYGNGQFLQWLMDREITPYMPTRDAVGRTRSPFYGPDAFTYLPESKSYICPAGQQLNYGGRNEGKSDARRIEKRLYLKRYDFVLGEVECKQVNLRTRDRMFADLSLLFLCHVNLERPTHPVVVGLQQGRNDALKIVHSVAPICCRKQSS